MHKQRHRTAASFDIANVARRRIDFALIRKELFAAHDFGSRLASPSFCAHSSQQTSTIRVPIWTLIADASRAQSHAAHVFSVIAGSPYVTPIGACLEDHCSDFAAVEIFSDFH